VFKTLAFVRGEIRVIDVDFENDKPYAVMEGTRLPLDADLLRHVEEVDARYFYVLELLRP
jgi:hypothetical protein